MRPRMLFFLSFAVCACALAGAKPAHTLKPLDKAPEGVSDVIAAAVDPNGYRVAGPDGPVCDIWLGNNLDVKPNFQPTLSIKYPFPQGVFLGVLRVPEGSEFTDFRGQELESGVYTLRYGQQPMDGNHIGTSELADFVLAIPAEDDKEPFPINFVQQLHTKSAAAAGTMHPAIFSLLPPEGVEKQANLQHDEEHEFWILNAAGTTESNAKKMPVVLRMVVIGETDI